MPVKFISSNIEGNKHWERLMPFFQKEEPEVLCLQEVFERDLGKLTEAFELRGTFLPLTNKLYRRDDPNSYEPWGIAILSTYPLEDSRTQHYYSPASEIQNYLGELPAQKRQTMHEGIVWAKIATPDAPMVYATTHFTWTPDGAPNDWQRQDMDALLKILDEIPEVILAGDFNIPRGHNDLYERLASRLHDAIPPEFPSSIDPVLHRMSNHPVEGPRIAKYMVDYIFTTPHYLAENVRLQEGVSDHKAIVAEISRVTETHVSLDTQGEYTAA